MEDFIHVYDNAVDSKFCTDLIDFFEWSRNNNRVWTREHEAMAHVKKDEATSLNPQTPESINFSYEQLGGYIQEFNTVFWQDIYKEYSDKFSALKDFSQHTIFSYKLQKTNPTEGYHVWHCEHGSPQFSRRIAAYILYLNDVEEGGETEFLYLSKRVKPKEGRLVLFPAGYTHTHRGNPPLSGTKYIMTGWVEFC